MAQDQIAISPSLADRLDRAGFDFLARILEVETVRHPDNIEALAELGHVYTRQGQHERGLGIDRRLVALVPDNPTVHYNLACSLAILGQRGDALDALETAVRLGYSDPDFMQKDEDLSNLRQEARFRDLVRRLGG